MKYIIVTLLTLFFSFPVFSQELTVKSFAPAPMDLTASTSPVKDLNGKECGLVKVRIPANDVIFEGNVVGDVKHKASEYLVYMTEGSYKLNVLCPNCLTLEINFRDYNVQRIESKRTYLLTILLPEGYSNGSASVSNLKLSLDADGHISASTGNKIIDDLISNMVYVEGGTFKRGATTKDMEKYGATVNEMDVFDRTLSSFFICKYETTQELWETLMGNNPSMHVGKKKPVENVSWDDCQEFIRRLNAASSLNFRLPTEAEWEYAARGGKISKGYVYSGNNKIDMVAWFHGNSDSRTSNVGEKKANELGLYDMSGNVAEWCYDRAGKYRDDTAIKNPRGITKGDMRIVRGGSFSGKYWDCIVWKRQWSVTNAKSGSIGFRLVLDKSN